MITGRYIQFNMKPAENFNREEDFILSYTWHDYRPLYTI